MKNIQVTYTENQQRMKELMDACPTETTVGEENVIRHLWKTNRDEVAPLINSLWTYIPLKLRMQYPTFKEMPECAVRFCLLMLYLSDFNPLRKTMPDRMAEWSREFTKPGGLRDGYVEEIQQLADDLANKPTQPIAGKDEKRKRVAKEYSEIG